MTGGPNECRKRALQCVQIADSSLDPKSRDIFADMAATWVQLAVELERIRTPWRETLAPRHYFEITDD
jgi:hypothetical protein